MISDSYLPGHPGLRSSRTDFTPLGHRATFPSKAFYCSIRFATCSTEATGTWLARARDPEQHLRPTGITARTLSSPPLHQQSVQKTRQMESKCTCHQVCREPERSQVAIWLWTGSYARMPSLEREGVLAWDEPEQVFSCQPLPFVELGLLCPASGMQ